NTARATIHLNAPRRSDQARVHLRARPRAAGTGAGVQPAPCEDAAGAAGAGRGAGLALAGSPGARVSLPNGSVALPAAPARSDHRQQGPALVGHLAAGAWRAGAGAFAGGAGGAAGGALARGAAASPEQPASRPGAT